jgi:phage terminase Nu1 subunit (DNA packaging protein)
MSAQPSNVVRFPARRTEDGHVYEPWIDAAALARHFGVSSRTVRRWRDAGMPSGAFGGARRYRVGECERWHSERERNA